MRSDSVLFLYATTVTVEEIDRTAMSRARFALIRFFSLCASEKQQGQSEMRQAALSQLLFTTVYAYPAVF